MEIVHGFIFAREINSVRTACTILQSFRDAESSESNLRISPREYNPSVRVPCARDVTTTKIN